MIKESIKKLIPSFLLSTYHWFLALLGAVFYGFPSKELIVIGVTGTNGKSTVINLFTLILQEAGYKTASLSSIKLKIAEKEWPNTLKMTMPGRLKLQKFLREAVKAGCKYAVLEVTSEGIKQHRHKFIDFNTAVFTNLTKEHIEAHGSFEKYKKSKGELFKSCRGTHVINLDDKNSQYFWQFQANNKIGYSLKDISKFQPLNLKLFGEFNIYNALAAIQVGLSQGIDLETCKKALEKVKSIPGRMETVIKKPFMVIVDYAHTPDALEKVYEAIDNHFPNTNNKICVLGAAGGGRDKWKRPELGKIADKYCQEIILTNEDPYDEDPKQILSEIESGISNPNLYQILDRRQAINKALGMAKSGDLVVITGKGSEPWMCLAEGKKIPWDDRKIAREEFK
ncbi:MAG TPA: UDP-N-acetylmuramoyl-L-alanyl-D-glutamate--2,6-diaminopimelate ligase [Candidatus Parcubacteria bacterium]|jgi:UDP-N-acetylmuramoyl-L-alanyl-D-glutamate--2,6-diaminopimelate ligase|nr:UDP-N-acetylmuramoyl-L-alanyl-D-glutamate--2,6-diaminopimelate ligase [Candidatus Parcubacteria bacterium]|tara:strand:+ start:414 stop:1601 length:1188 start_codon:yes stop_codon:yes gene_type:complete